MFYSHEAVSKFVADALADGWVCETDRIVAGQYRTIVIKHQAEGFSATVCLRQDSADFNGPQFMEIFGPDQAQILTVVYDMDELRAALRRCDACGAGNTDVQIFEGVSATTLPEYSVKVRLCAKCLGF